jgi:hypothetical protein
MVPPLPRKLSAGFCTAECTCFLRISAFFPHVLHKFSIRVFRTIYVKFFRSDFGGSPKEIADPAVKKNGEKKAGGGRVWKRGVWRGLAVRALGGGWARAENRLDEKEAVNAQVLWHVEQFARLG